MKAQTKTANSSAERSDTMFEVEGVSMTYDTARGPLNAVSDVDLDIRRSEFLSLIGPSGCGKSTLLEIIGGMRRATAGEVRLEGEPISGPKPDRISFVFQNYSLFPWRSVLRNVEAGMEFQGISKSERRDRARASLQLVGMDDFRDAFPSECSGGMQQRVAIARALACEPDVLLMDEPFGALDEQTRLVLGEELGRVLDTTDCTIVFVTHSLSEAVLLSDRVVVMQSKPGRIRRIYEVDAERPRTGDFMATKQFAELHRELFETLRDEIRANDAAGTVRTSTSRHSQTPDPAAGLPADTMGRALALDDKFVDVDGIRTRYLEEGSGHPIVLFHGGEFGGNTGAHVFSPELYKTLAAAGHRVVGIDRLGQAQTDNPQTPEGYRISAVIAHSIATLEALSITDATVLGQSRGAYVAARIAVERPDLVRRLVLINSGSLAPGVGVEPKPGDLTYAVYNEMMTGEARNDAEALSYTLDHITEEWLEECQRYADAEKSKEAKTALSSVERTYFDEFAAQKDDTLDRLAAGAYTGPTLIIWGVGDRTLTHESSIALFDVFKDQSEHLRMYVINRSGHSVFREYPDEVSRQVVDFVATT